MPADHPRRTPRAGLASARTYARTAIRALALAALSASTIAACSGSSVATRPDGLDPETLPPELRDDYEVFAQRCSRCHSLARPLTAGFNDMDQWRNYVARMRRQPSSGISPQDEVQVLAFLEYFTAQRRSRASGSSESAPAPTVVVTPQPVVIVAPPGAVVTAAPAPAATAAPSPTPVPVPSLKSHTLRTHRLGGSR